MPSPHILSIQRASSSLMPSALGLWVGQGEGAFTGEEDKVHWP